MSVVTDRVPVDRIREEAVQLPPRAVVLALCRSLLALLAGLLYGTGWVAAKAVRLLWSVISWSVAAVRVGFKDGARGNNSG
jgi:hypothetical protein